MISVTASCPPFHFASLLKSNLFLWRVYYEASEEDPSQKITLDEVLVWTEIHWHGSTWHILICQSLEVIFWVAGYCVLGIILQEGSKMVKQIRFQAGQTTWLTFLWPKKNITCQRGEKENAFPYVNLTLHWSILSVNNLRKQNDKGLKCIQTQLARLHCCFYYVLLWPQGFYH